MLCTYIYNMYTIQYIILISFFPINDHSGHMIAHVPRVLKRKTSELMSQELCNDLDALCAVIASALLASCVSLHKTCNDACSLIHKALLN